MKYVYGARKLNETNADDRSNTIMRARSSSLDTTVSRSIIDSTLFSPLPLSLLPLTSPPDVSLHRVPSHHPSPSRLPGKTGEEASCSAQVNQA